MYTSKELAVIKHHTIEWEQQIHLDTLTHGMAEDEVFKVKIKLIVNICMLNT